VDFVPAGGVIAVLPVTQRRIACIRFPTPQSARAPRSTSCLVPLPRINIPPPLESTLDAGRCAVDRFFVRAVAQIRRALGMRRKVCVLAGCQRPQKRRSLAAVRNLQTKTLIVPRVNRARVNTAEVCDAAHNLALGVRFRIGCFSDCWMQ
jgi:hypothetical protein